MMWINPIILKKDFYQLKEFVISRIPLCGIKVIQELF